MYNLLSTFIQIPHYDYMALLKTVYVVKGNKEKPYSPLKQFALLDCLPTHTFYMPLALPML